VQGFKAFYLPLSNTFAQVFEKATWESREPTSAVTFFKTLKKDGGENSAIAILSYTK
jgi:hypothetical protein